MDYRLQAPTPESFVSEGSKKRRRNSGSREPEPVATFSGQLSLLDVWGNGRSAQDQGWKIGVKYRKQVSRVNRNNPYKYYNRNGNHHRNQNYSNTRNPEAPSTSVKVEVLDSSSLASKTNSDLSLFSSPPSSPQSAATGITDGFDDLDLEFDPKLFVLEVDPDHGLHPSWLERLKPVLMQPEIISLHQRLGSSHIGYDYKAGQEAPNPLIRVLPDAKQLYNWSRLTPLDEVKVVILGSRPSQSLGQSHGLAFSQPVNCQRLSGPIESIHRELSIEYPDQFVKPYHGSLVSWARSGVLLLNEMQTTSRDHPNEHSKFGWFGFATKILELVSRFGGSMYSSDTSSDSMDTSSSSDSTTENTPGSTSIPSKGIVFIAWGEEALQLIRSSNINFSDRNHQVLSCKGSPYANSAHDNGFFNNNHFISCNQFLSSAYGPEHQIDWCNLQPLDPPS